MHFKLVTFSTKLCTIGKWYHGKELICKTMEKPWLLNAKGISCIGAGLYDLIPRVSPSSGPTFYLSNPELGVSLSDESGRTYIQIDAVNFEDELDGCIGVGEGFNVWNGKLGVTHSRVTRGYLMEMLGKESHTIEIVRN